jgi:type II secretion system protein N
MQKVGRLVLVLIAGVSIFAAALFLALNLYVQSQGTQARIEQELRQRLGADLKIGRVSVTPWNGLRLSDITMAQGANGSGSNFLEAKNFGLRVAFFSLFSRKLVIREVSLVNPTVVWPQNADGKWRLPDLRRDRVKNVPLITPEPESSAAASEKLSSPTEDLASSPPPTQLRKENAPTPFAPEIHKISVTNGNFRFVGRANEPEASFEGVGFRASVTSATALHGHAQITKLSVRDRFFLQQVKTPFRYDDSGLDLPQISAKVGDGEVNGRFTIQPETDESPFRVEVKFRNVQADQIISEAGGPSGVLQGKLDGSLQTEGKTTNPDAIAGTGEVFLKDGQVRQYNLLVALGQIFQIEELTQLHLDQAEAKYHLTPGVVNIDELDLRSTNIHLSATGTVSFRGKLHLNSRLAINEKVRAQLFKPIRSNFQPTDEPDYSAVDFEVTGTVERPKTNLLEKVVGKDLKDLVNSFWGGGKGEKQKKKKGKARDDEEPEPQNSPETSASPSGSP